MIESISTKSSLQETHLTQINYQTVWPNYHFFIGGTVSLHFLELFAHRFSTAHYRNRRDISGAGWPTFFLSFLFLLTRRSGQFGAWQGGLVEIELKPSTDSATPSWIAAWRYVVINSWSDDAIWSHINSSSCRMHLNPRPSDPTGEKFGRRRGPGGLLAT